MKAFVQALVAAAWLCAGPGHAVVSAAKLSLKLGQGLGMKLSVDMLSPDGLQGIENSLLALTQEGKATPGLQPFLDQIWDLTYQMQDQIRYQSNSSQISLTRAWEDFLSCRYEPANESNVSELADLNRSHIVCRHGEKEAYEEEEECWYQTGILNATVAVRKQEFDIYDDDWPQNCVYPEPFPDPEQSSKPYLEELRDNFRGLFNGWNSSYWAWNASVELRDAKVAECQTLREGHLAHRRQCDSKQGQLESSTCGDGGEECDRYIDCYNCNERAWLAANSSAANAEETFLQEWRGILRIQCLLNAFNESEKEDGTSLNDGIDQCRSTDFSGRAYNEEIRIPYHPGENETVPELHMCNETHFKYHPGTSEWIQTYYTNLPDHTTHAACNATCCRTVTVGCCYSIGFGSRMAPCCLTTQDLDEESCLQNSSSNLTGGMTGWHISCPASADVAYAEIQESTTTTSQAPTNTSTTLQDQL